MKALIPKVINHVGTSVDLSQVKCFKLSYFSDIGKKNTVTIEFKKRIEYIFLELGISFASTFQF